MRAVTIAIVAVGLCIGASAGWFIANPSQKPATELYVSLQGDTVQNGIMESGWQPSSVRGTALASSVAILSIPQAEANRDYLVDIETVGERARNEQPVRVEMSANSRVFGSFDLQDASVHRLLLPASLNSSGAPLSLTFRSSAKPLTSILIRSITLRDASRLLSTAGNLDYCKGEHVFGWAAASDGPAPIMLRRDGVETGYILQAGDRPDLPASGFPRNAGFALKLLDPIRPGEKVEVVLSNRKVLSGVECTP